MFKQIVGKEICFGYETIRKARVCIYIMMEWDNTINKKSMIASVNLTGNIEFYTTGDPIEMEKQIFWFDKKHEQTKKIEL